MNLKFIFVIYCLAFLCICNLLLGQEIKKKPSLQYKSLQEKLCNGWNTWDSQNMLSHVLLPEGLSVTVALKNRAISPNQYLNDVAPGGKFDKPIVVKAGAHSYHGEYSSVTVKWEGVEMLVQSATENGELFLLITPVAATALPPRLIIESGMLWNKPGTIVKKTHHLEIHLPHRSLKVQSTTSPTNDLLPLKSPYLSFSFDEEIGIYTGVEKTREEIRFVIEKKKREIENAGLKYGELSEAYSALRSVLAWNQIYDPVGERVITPVSRMWNYMFGGNVLFCWDTYFAAYMASLDNKELAYSNAINITKSIVPGGFVPNYTTPYQSSFDRSQPPIGSMVVREIYRRYKEKWFLQEVFEDLLSWNEWWPQHRQNTNGLLSWGSDSTAFIDQDPSAFTMQGALYESGLDNSPMYDSVNFNKEKSIMDLGDVGLTSLYIADCQALADIARVLGKNKEAGELEKRAAYHSKFVQKLWDHRLGMFLNYNVPRKHLSKVLSPTLFYPWIADVPKKWQTSRMLKDHFYNQEEFYSPWMLPSVSKNHPSYPAQDYWRGRIWPPMNFLVYLGLQHYGLSSPQSELARKSMDLFMKNYLANGAIHENYNCISGNGVNKEEGVGQSDSFYHWGALLAFMSFFEKGYMEKPLEPLPNK